MAFIYLGDVSLLHERLTTATYSWDVSSLTERLTISRTAGRISGLCLRKGKSADMQDNTQDCIKGSCNKKCVYTKTERWQFLNEEEKEINY